MKQYTIDGGTLQKILNYLANEPYVKVFEIVKEIQAQVKEVASSGSEDVATPSVDSSASTEQAASA